MNNLIGISGKIGSGKDTVGKILQYLSAGNELSKTTPDLVADWEYDWYAGTKMGNYQIKKYADKLKDIVCMLIGCTREQLEDREFKEKELGEEWRVHYNWHYKLKSDSNPTGRAGKLFFTREESDLEMLSVTYNGLAHGTYLLTPRLLLQLLGTDCGRDIIHPNIWVNALFADYKDEYIGDWGMGNHMYEKPNWIITDVRFPNEAKAIKDRGGIVIRVNRFKIITETLPDGTKCSFIPNPLFDGEEHPSETALDYYVFDHVIDNNCSIEELVEKVKQLNLV